MKHTRKLRLEYLEDRTVPALLLNLDAYGNLVSIVGVPSGDVDVNVNAADTVQVIENGNDLGTYSVPGNLSVSLGNRVAFTSVTFDFTGGSLSGNLAVSAGNSVNGYFIGLGDAVVAGNVSVRTGNGPDSITFFGAAIDGSVTVDSGAGFDSVTAGFGTVFGGNYSVTNGDFVASDVPFDVGGNLTINSRQSSGVTIAMGVNVAGNAIINTGNGGDLVRFNEDSSIGGNMVVNTAAGNDSVQMGSGIGPAGTVTVLGSMTINVGAGNDQIQLGGDGCTIGGNLTVIGGNGVNTLTFATGATVLGRSITYVGGNGADTVNVDELTAPGARMSVQGGAGADTLNFDATLSTVASLFFDGGTGVDAFNATGVIAFPTILRNVP